MGSGVAGTQSGAIRASTILDGQMRHATTGVRLNPVTIRFRNLYRGKNINDYGKLDCYAAQLWRKS